MNSTRPEKINRVWFRTRYGQNFPDLLSEDKNSFLDTCIEDVYTMFAGVEELWDHLGPSIYVNKTQMCYGLLVAWYIADLNPEYAIGVAGTGGMPVKRKNIGGVDIWYADAESKAGSKNNADLLNSLKSNIFGVKAYMMIKTSGKMNYIRSR